MDLRKQIRITLSLSAIAEIRQIAEAEGRSEGDVRQLLIKAGLRAYKRGRPLLCGYPDCTRKECCGPSQRRGQIITFPTTERGH